MSKYDELADKIVDLLGGKDNISFYAHCVTRLRFNLKNKALVKKDEIEQLPGVIGSQWSGDQYQVIIGQSVADAYDLIAKKNGLQTQKMIDENLGDTEKKKKKFSIGAFFDAFSGVMAPLIPVLGGAGLVKVLVVILLQTGLLTKGSPTHTVLSFIGDAGIYYLPVFIGYSGAKKFGANPAIGMMLGAILIHPNFINAVTEGTALSIFKIPVYGAKYASSVFPMFLTMFVCGYVEKFIARHTPDLFRPILEPLLTILVMSILELCLLAPIGNWIGIYFAKAIMWLYKTVGFIGIAILAAIYPYIVMTGMHTGFAPYIFTSFSQLGLEPVICPSNFISNMCQGAACAAIAIKTKNKNLKSTSMSAAISAIIGGVTEPAMFGVTMKVKRGMWGAMIGSFVAGIIAGINKCAAYTLPGNGGIFGTIAFIGGNHSFMWQWIAMGTGMAVTFIVTLFTYHDEAEKAE